MGSVGRCLFVLCLLLAGCANEIHVALNPAGSTSPGDPRVQREVEEAIDRTPTVSGNRVDLLRDGTETMPAMFEAMRHAKDSINLEFYIFDEVRSGGQTLSDVLIDRLRHGVAVSIIYDAVGSIDTSGSFLARLARAGAVMIAFNPSPSARGKFDSPNHRDHRKILVVDGRIGFTGGINFDHVYANPPTPGVIPLVELSYWRDIGLRVTGPVVADLQRRFFETWAQQNGPSLPPRDWFPALVPTGDDTVRILASAPGDGQPLYYVWLLHALHAARRSIGLITGYFVPTHQEEEELVRAARRGVEVRLVLPGRSDLDDAISAGRAAYGDLLEAGAKIYENHDEVLHSKLAIIDGVLMGVGSSNFDRRSAAYNNEIDAVVVGPSVADGEALLDHDIRTARTIDLPTWRARPIEQRVHELRAWLWEFLL